MNKISLKSNYLPQSRDFFQIRHTVLAKNGFFWGQNTTFFNGPGGPYLQMFIHFLCIIVLQAFPYT